MAKVDTKVNKTGLNKYLHCSVDPEMVLRAQELAPSGIMLIILSQNAIFTKQSKDLEFWHLKGSGQDLKKYLKIKILTCNLPLFLILHTYMY